MSTYLTDTNVIINYGNDPLTKAKVDRASTSGSRFVVTPPTMTELTVGVVKGGEARSAQNKVMFEWLKAQSSNILDLPRACVGKILGFPSKKCDVDVDAHVQRIELVTRASDFADFLRRKAAPSSVFGQGARATIGQGVHRSTKTRQAPSGFVRSCCGSRQGIRG